MAEVQLPEVLSPELAADARQVQSMSDALRIKIDDSEAVYEAACTFIATRIHPGIKRITAFFEPLKKKAHEAHKALTTAEAQSIAPYEALKAQVDKEATAWRQNQQRKRDEALKKEREEADARAEVQRAEDAAALADMGDQEAAEELLAAPIVPIVIESTAPIIPQVSGVSAPKPWVCDIMHEESLIKWIAEDYMNRRHYLAKEWWNKQQLNRKATSDRTAMLLPGCKAREDERTQFRAPRG